MFGPAAEVRLFGSRLDDDARGGDIDLLVVLREPIADAHGKELTFVARLQRRLGDQRIDVLVVEPGRPKAPVHQVALRDGIPL